MTGRMFPTHLRIILDAAEQSALGVLYDLDSHLLDEMELIHDALHAGVEVLNQQAAARKKDPDRPPTRTEVEARKKALARQDDDDLVTEFPKRIELDLTLEQQERMQYLADHLPHESDEALLSEVLSRGIDIVQHETRHDLASPFKPSFAPSKDGVAGPSHVRGPRHEVPNYIGIPLEDDLRERLQQFLDSYPGTIDEEEGYAMLLDLGLDTANHRPIADPAKPARQRRLARVAKLRAVVGGRR